MNQEEEFPDYFRYDPDYYVDAEDCHFLKSVYPRDGSEEINLFSAAITTNPKMEEKSNDSTPVKKYSSPSTNKTPAATNSESTSRILVIEPVKEKLLEERMYRKIAPKIICSKIKEYIPELKTPRRRIKPIRVKRCRKLRPKEIEYLKRES